MKVRAAFQNMFFVYNVVKLTRKRILLFFISILIVISSLFPIVTLDVTRRILNNIQSGSPVKETIKLFITMISIQIFSQLIMYFIQFNKNLFYIKMSNLIPELIMKKIANLAADKIFHEKTQDELYFLRTQTSEKISSVFENLFSLLSAFTTLTSMFIYVANWNMMYALIIFLISMPLGITQVYFNQKKFRLSKRLNRPYREQFYIQYISTTGSYLKEIITNNSMGRLIKEYKDIFKGTYYQQKKLMKKEYIASLFLSLMSFMVIGFLEFKLVMKAVNGELLLGTFTSLLQAINSVSIGINALILVMSNFYGDLLYVNNLKDFLSEKNEKSFEKNYYEDVKKIDSKSFILKGSDLSFHIGNKEIFRDLNFELESGKIHGILGDNGSGKTTLLEVIQGLKKQTTGSIYFNNMDLDLLSKEERFEIIQMLFQQPSRYEFSFEDNITISDFEKEPTENVFEFIKRIDDESKIETIVSSSNERLGDWYEDSRPLSGGQWQTISFYRLLYRESPIYLIDEPTNNLDYHSIQRMKNTLKKIKDNGFLVIVVSHDLEFMESICDNLIDMKALTSRGKTLINS
ncbi:hypothetical protein ADM98_00740 [Exiguobacterium sp. BMC-KP]|uniref:ATP-binding cassette domain-containing protein n=1 Tax=Exiguobacterium sp. BMC-KP TaxID=1684312 RepID=UPI0006AA4F85|nr:ATP-binding cassette domain-containing protein [Exiguobacterium sp. BMC-KP]KOP31407.1 hypothetical protein ADM98_00740 [Exiguobacterium sp. BMC-KP]